MKDILRRIALKLCIGTAYVCIAIAVILSALPFSIAYLVILGCDDLEAEWRRGRKQNWLWRWARGGTK